MSYKCFLALTHSMSPVSLKMIKTHIPPLSFGGKVLEKLTMQNRRRQRQQKVFALMLPA
jgi:hypothetical protein